MNPLYHKLAKKSTLFVLACLLLPGISLARQPNDTHFAKQPFYQQINSLQAWDYTVGSKDMVVAVIDNGFDINHPDLQDNIWKNIEEIPNNNRDDDDNGYVDDINGWDFVDGDNSVGFTNLEPETEKDNLSSHGTISLGLIGAVGNNNKNGVGINWKVRIMPLRSVANNGVGFFVDVAKAVDYAVDNGADVINLSLVSDLNNESLKNSIKRAYEKGVVVAAAVGNEGNSSLGFLNTNPSYPACYDKDSVENFVIGVASIDYDDTLSKFSSYGNCVDLSAPGRNINSTLYVDSKLGLNTEFGGNAQGTSFSTPLVSGAAALLKSIVPSWEANQINNFLVNNSDDIDFKNSAGLRGYVGKRLNVGKIIKKAVSSVSYLQDSIREIYYSSGNEVFSYNFNTKVTNSIDRLLNSDLVDFNFFNVNRIGQQELIMLTNRSGHYFVRIDGFGGKFVNEFALNNIKSSNGKYVKIKVDVVNDVVNYIVELRQNNKIILEKYLANGTRQSQIEIKADKWDVVNDKIYLATISNNKLFLEKKDWSGNKLESFDYNTNDGVILDFVTKDINEWSGPEQLVLIKEGGKTKQLIADIVGGGFREVDIENNLSDINRWSIQFDPYNKVVWPINFEGGKFPLLIGGHKWVGERELIKIKNVQKVIVRQ
jgi:subtilisin family serine protease